MKFAKYALAAAAGLLWLALPGALRADTTFTYTGNPYTSCTGSFTCNGTTPYLTITFDTTLTGSQLDSLSGNPGYDISPYIISFTITDGEYVDITNSDALSFTFDINTSPTGSMESWYITAISGVISSPGFQCAQSSVGFTSYCTITDPSIPPGSDESSLPFSGDFGYNLTSGTWSEATITTPEPSALLLLGVGLLGLIGMGGHKKRLA
jgi:hypothetical protein